MLLILSVAVKILAAMERRMVNIEKRLGSENKVTPIKTGVKNEDQLEITPKRSSTFPDTMYSGPFKNWETLARTELFHVQKFAMDGACSTWFTHRCSSFFLFLLRRYSNLWVQVPKVRH